jgi:hypothetical protein
MQRDLLPKGAVISYCDEIATVVEDFGRTLTVHIEGGGTMMWYWHFDGEECVVVSLPEEGTSI